MEKILLIMEDGRIKEFNTSVPIQALMHTVHYDVVENIVFGEVDSSGIVWEKQFKPVDVLPASFGK